MEDSCIVELYLKRSETAILETDRKYNAFLHQVAYNILHDASDSDEIVNDTYMGHGMQYPLQNPTILSISCRVSREISPLCLCTVKKQATENKR